MIVNGSIPVGEVDDKLLQVAAFIEEVTPLLTAYNQTPTTESAQAVADCLHKARGGVGRKPLPTIILIHGACWLASRLGGLSIHLDDDAVKQFEHYSGDSTYPVAHPEIADPDVAYTLAMDMWVGEYGLRRIAFLQLFKDAAIKAIGGKHPRPMLN